MGLRGTLPRLGVRELRPTSDDEGCDLGGQLGKTHFKDHGRAGPWASSQPGAIMRPADTAHAQRAPRLGPSGMGGREESPNLGAATLGLEYPGSGGAPDEEGGCKGLPNVGKAARAGAWGQAPAERGRAGAGLTQH